MPTVAMPLDANKNSIPTLSFSRGGGAHQISFSGTSARNSTPINSSVVSIYATEDCFIEIGSSSVVATSSNHFIPAKTYLDIELSDGSGYAKYIAVIQASTSGTLYISERS